MKIASYNSKKLKTYMEIMVIIEKLKIEYVNKDGDLNKAILFVPGRIYNILKRGAEVGTCDSIASLCSGLKIASVAHIKDMMVIVNRDDFYGLREKDNDKI